MQPKHGVKRIESEEVPIDESDDSTQHETELSLEELSAAYSQLISEPNGGGLQFEVPSNQASPEKLDSHNVSSNQSLVRDSGESIAVHGQGIIEALLFVGSPDNAGINPSSIAGIMRGVVASEIIDWMTELNQRYIDQGHVMRIVHDELGYRMILAPEFQSIGDSLNGKLRETQLNQAAIDCLSLVAYRPGITKEELERLWNRSAGNVLGLLVRRELLRIEREGKGKQGVTRYFPTDRFLNLIGIASLEDLPTAESEFE